MRTQNFIATTAGLAALVLTACGPTQRSPAEAVAAREQAIRGGTSDSNDPAVVALAVRDQGYYEQFCTGTLVGAKTVLTAAHCINAYGQGNFYYVLFGQNSDAPSKRVHVTSQIANPNYRGEAYDFGLLRLDEVVTGITPIELNSTPLTAGDIGKPIRHVGFGTTDGQSGAGLKRTVTYNIRNITGRLIESGASGQQTCGGDSGGPAFMTFPGSNVERVAGVVSFGDENCLQNGYDGRVDVEVQWMKTTMSTWEVPTCLDDGACVQGCTPVDPDCACVADGQCTTACERPEKDPDCPRNCGADGVCGTSICPRPDPDCVRDGELCTTANQCRGRQCVTDAQHPAKYCSATCGGDADCPSGMGCQGSTCLFPQLPERQPFDTCTEENFCVSGRICNGPSGGVRRCVMPCTSGTNCSGDEICEGGSTGQRYCRPPPSAVSFAPPVLQKIDEQMPAAGCSAAGGSLSLALLGLLTLARRRRS